MIRAQPECRLNCYVADRLRRHLDPATVFWTTIEHGGWRTPETAERMMRIDARAGLLDLLLIVRGGRAFWIELKADGGSMSAAQEKMADWFRCLGVSDESDVSTVNGNVRCKWRSGHDAEIPE